jgi:hemerythrin superfamily protein
VTNAHSLTGSHLDVVGLIEADHRTVRALFARFADAGASDRASLWPELVRTLVAHEVAEEVVVYPAIRKVTDEYEPMVKARLSEQAEAEEMLARMERMDPAAVDFSDLVARLGRAVVEHAEAEERELLPAITRFGESFDRIGLGARYQETKHRAPTHPHPGSPDRPPGNVVMGPIVGLFDRMRDRMH